MPLSKNRYIEQQRFFPLTIQHVLAVNHGHCTLEPHGEGQFS
jgi:hypothetical protein